MNPREPCNPDPHRMMPATDVEDAGIGESVARPNQRSVYDTREFPEFSDTARQQSPVGLHFFLFLREDQRLLGYTGLTCNTPRCASTGYVLTHDAWDFGNASKSLMEMKTTRSILDVVRLYALCHPEHVPAIRVPGKCGFDFDRIIFRPCVVPNRNPGKSADVVSYSWRRR